MAGFMLRMDEQMLEAVNAAARKASKSREWWVRSLIAAELGVSDFVNGQYSYHSERARAVRKLGARKCRRGKSRR